MPRDILDAMCHNLKPFKLNDEDPLSFYNLKNIFHLSRVIMYVADFYGNIWMAYNNIHMVEYLLTIDFIHTCN
jgi:hypothetical protein